MCRFTVETERKPFRPGFLKPSENYTVQKLHIYLYHKGNPPVHETGLFAVLLGVICGQKPFDLCLHCPLHTHLNFCI